MSEKNKALFGMFSKKQKAEHEMEESLTQDIVTAETDSMPYQADVAVTVDNLPAALAAHFEQLTVLEDKILSAGKKANEARAVALTAKKKSAGFFGRKKAVEALQATATLQAQAQADIMGAIEASFAHQRKISEIINQMLLLCVSNLAGTRELLAQLQAELKKVEKGDYSANTKAEMARIIQELKNQEDYMSKQAKQSAMLQQHGSDIQHHTVLLQASDEHQRVTDQAVTDIRQTVKGNEGKIAELSKQLLETQSELEKSRKLQRISIGLAFGVAVLAVLLAVF